MRRFAWRATLWLGIGAGTWCADAAPSVTSFSPEGGGAGQQVSVQGAGFTGAARVQFNSTPADFQVISSTRLTATVPVEATYGPIRVSVGGLTGDSGVRFFLPMPRVEEIRPTRGAVNTTVVLEGVNFVRVEEVRFGEKVAVFSVPAPEQIRAAVPAGLTNPVPITVVTEVGSAVSAQLFTLTGPAPIVDELVPAFGAPGTEVAVLGANLTNVTAVQFGGVLASQFNAPAPTRLNAVVPSGAVTGPVRVTTTGGFVDSAQEFLVTLVPVITSVSPTIGKPGTAVKLQGVNFEGARNVWFNGLQVPGWGTPATGEISTTVPQGALTGKITVQNASGYGASEEDFVIPVAPVVLGLDRWEGQAGVTPVQITGFNLNGSQLWFNGVQAGYSPGGTTEGAEIIRTTVPLAATTGPIGLTNGGGGMVTAQSFFVYGGEPYLRGMVPGHGPRGSQVHLEGENFFPPITVRFNGVEAPDAVAVAPSEIVVTVPASATTGPVQVTTPNGLATSSAVFHLPPRISAFLPATASEGEVVTLEGANLGYALAVDFGGVMAGFEPGIGTPGTVLKATVPVAAVRGPIRVTTPGGVIMSATEFVVAPGLTSFEPELGPPLTPIVLHGTGFRGVGNVLIGGRVAVHTVDSPNEIRATVPAAVGPGPAPITVITTEGTVVSSTPFYVTTSTDLELTLDQAEVVLSPGEEVTFVYSLKNRGTSPATSVQVEEVLPPGVEHLAAETSRGTWQPTAGGVLFDVGVLMNGETADFSTTSRAVEEGVWSQHVLAWASMAESDWDPANSRVQLNLAVIEPGSLVLDIVPTVDLGQVVCQWPVSPLSLELQAADDLSPGSVWEAVEGDPVAGGGVWRLTNTVTGVERYFRLQLPFPSGRTGQ